MFYFFFTAFLKVPFHAFSWPIFRVLCFELAFKQDITDPLYHIITLEYLTLIISEDHKSFDLVDLDLSKVALPICAIISNPECY